MKILKILPLVAVLVTFSSISQSSASEHDSPMTWPEIAAIVDAYNSLVPKVIEIAKANGLEDQLPENEISEKDMQIDVSKVDHADQFDAQTVSLLQEIIDFARSNAGKVRELNRRKAAYMQSNDFTLLSNNQKASALENWTLMQAEELGMPEYEDIPWVKMQIRMGDLKSEFETLEDYDAHYKKIDTAIDRLPDFESDSWFGNIVEKIPYINYLQSGAQAAKKMLRDLAAKFRPLDEAVFTVSGPDGSEVEWNERIGEIPRDRWEYNAANGTWSLKPAQKK